MSTADVDNTFDRGVQYCILGAGVTALGLLGLAAYRSNKSSALNALTSQQETSKVLASRQEFDEAMTALWLAKNTQTPYHDAMKSRDYEVAVQDIRKASEHVTDAARALKDSLDDALVLVAPEVSRATILDTWVARGYVPPMVVEGRPESLAEASLRHILGSPAGYEGSPDWTLQELARELLAIGRDSVTRYVADVLLRRRADDPQKRDSFQQVRTSLVKAYDQADSELERLNALAMINTLQHYMTTQGDPWLQAAAQTSFAWRPFH